MGGGGDKSPHPPYVNGPGKTLNTVVHKQSYRVVAKPVSQRTAAAEKGPLKFTESAFFFSFAQIGSQLSWNGKTGCVLDALKALV